ncbi:MAG: MFS transporter [Candidatus Hermodarchaeota archaeon]
MANSTSDFNENLVKFNVIKAENKMETKPTITTFQHYLFFWGGQIFSLLGSITVHFLITWYLTETTQNPTVLALARICYIVPLIISSPLAGVFSDRLNRKVMILIVDSSQAFTTFILIIFMTFGFTYYWIFLIFIIIRNVFQGFHQSTIIAIIPTMVPKEKLSRINGINLFSTGIVQLIGPTLAGTLLAFLRTNFILSVALQQALWLDIITFIIALGPLLVIKIPKVRSKEEKTEKKSFMVEFIEGLSTIWMVPGAFILLMMGILLNLIIQPLNVLFPYYVNIIHLGDELDYALFSMGFQAGIICGSILTTVKKKWNHKIYTSFTSLVLVMMGYMFLAIAPTRAIIVIFLSEFLMGFFHPINSTVIQTITQTTVPHDKLGRATSIGNAFSLLMIPIGAFLAGYLVEILGIRLLFFLSAMGGLVIIISLYMFTGIRNIDFDKDHEEGNETII